MKNFRLGKASGKTPRHGAWNREEFRPREPLVARSRDVLHRDIERTRQATMFPFRNASARKSAMVVLRLHPARIRVADSFSTPPLKEFLF
ncbi:MAG: hypothetical protein U1B84_05330 [Variovorax sp.]|nr:hypothetical protein [Variovorax sp.]